MNDVFFIFGMAVFLLFTGSIIYRWAGKIGQHRLEVARRQGESCRQVAELRAQMKKDDHEIKN